MAPTTSTPNGFRASRHIIICRLLPVRLSITPRIIGLRLNLRNPSTEAATERAPPPASTASMAGVRVSTAMWCVLAVSPLPSNPS